MKKFNHIFHRHVEPEDLDHRFVECTMCDFSFTLDENERWWGFNGENEILSDIVKRTDYFCYQCGKQTVVEEIGDVNYYFDPSYYCDSCNSRFTMGL